MFGQIGTWEIFLLVLVVLLLFGSKQLPELARNFGKKYSEFQKTSQDVQNEFRKILDDEEKDDKEELKG